MARVNERTFEYTPSETRFDKTDIAPGQELRSTPFDVRGAKIFCAWVKCLGGSCEAYFEYLCEEAREILQVTEPRTLTGTEDYYTRFQFGTYGDVKIGRAELPALYLVLVVRNVSQQTSKIIARGMSQLQ